MNKHSWLAVRGARWLAGSRGDGRNEHAKAGYFTRMSLLLAVSRSRYCSVPCWISSSRLPASKSSLVTIRGTVVSGIAAAGEGGGIEFIEDQRAF